MAMMKLPRIAVLLLGLCLTSGVTGQTCNPDSPRTDCGYVGITQQQCEDKGCCWNPKDDNPWCFYPTSTTSYSVTNIETTTLGVKLTLETNSSRPRTPSAIGTNISPLTVEVSMETTDRLHVKIYDPNNKRWEIPTSVSPVPDPPSQPPSNPQYSYTVPKVGEAFCLAVVRVSTKETVFNTSTSLQFADQYLQIGTSLPANYNLYGIGEHVAPLRLTTGTWTLWNYDTATPQHLNVYGSHPFYLDLRTSGHAHGVFLRNSNGMDVVLGDTSLQYMVIGGILDFYIFLGPEPEAVIQQYQEVIGRPHLPPYWSLGFHQCRYGYPNVEAIEQVVANYASNKIPLDTMWTDIDYMDQYKDFTLDPNNFPSDKMNQFVNQLHSNGQHYVVITDPGMKNEKGYKPYDDGVSEDIFVKDKNGNIFIGKVWPGNTAFPDFLNPKASQYWQDQVSTFHQLLPVDGLWIDMNEISNFCSGECSNQQGIDLRDWRRRSRVLRSVKFDPNNPPYHIHNQGSQNIPLNSKTLDMDAQHYGGVLEYNAHNLFGLTEAIATNKALMNVRGKRSFVLSRSTFPSSGMHTGHWTGDNHAQEFDLYISIPGMLNFQMFGVPLVGSDICGFIGDTSEELCSRWMELGAFYPFSRNHNTKGAASQEPYVWPSVAAISRKVLAIRYSLLPYYYTLFYKANRKVDSQSPPSATVTRPLFFEFPTDSQTYSIDQQFMVGPGLLITPVLKLGQNYVNGYFPSAKWYDWYFHNVTSMSGGQSINIYAPVDHIPIHIRGGSIIPLQGPGLTTTASRQNDFALIVALNGSGQAQGDLFLDDGESINVTSYTFVDYSAGNNKIMATVFGNGYASSAQVPPLGSVSILGVQGTPTKAQLNGQPISGFSFNTTTSALYLTGLSADMGSKFTITWS